MLTISIGQLEAWLIQYFWPFVRIGACLMVAPVIGALPAGLAGDRQRLRRAGMGERSGCRRLRHPRSDGVAGPRSQAPLMARAPETGR